MRVHIVGVCGTAMGGVAVLLKSLGFEVSGSDSLFYPPISDQLKKFGIRTYGFLKRM
jgi:UDP-N-acetylmuramate-alanine ligase